MEGLGTPPVGQLRDVSIENLVARNAGTTGCSISGIPGHPLKNISIRNFSLQFRGGVKVSEPEEAVPELETLYPEATMFGTLPASVFFLRHVEGIDISDIRVDFLEPDERAHLLSQDVEGLNYEEIQINKER